eukprot:364222-Chlamydomonas_euryale.AAC.9
MRAMLIFHAHKRKHTLKQSHAHTRTQHAHVHSCECVSHAHTSMYDGDMHECASTCTHTCCVRVSKVVRQTVARVSLHVLMAIKLQQLFIEPPEKTPADSTCHHARMH